METPIRSEVKLETSSLNNTIKVSGSFTVKEKIHGPIDLSTDTNRCSLDLKSCEKYGSRNIRGLCKMIDNPILFFSDVFAKIKPPTKCPLMPGNYTISESEIDLSLFNYAPVDGYVYMINLKIVSTEKGSKARKIAWCFNLETKITKTRVRS
jgi:hypothetical protein